MNAIIETERLYLRELTQDDYDSLKAVISDAETMKYYDKPYDDAGVQRWLDWNFDNYADCGFGLWALVLKSSGEMIGDCGITIQNIHGRFRPEIGYHINKKYWNTGFGKEAAAACRDWAFENTSFRRLYSYMNAENAASYSTARSIGMKQVDEYTDAYGEHLLVYSVSKDDIRR